MANELNLEPYREAAARVDSGEGSLEYQMNLACWLGERASRLVAEIYRLQAASDRASREARWLRHFVTSLGFDVDEVLAADPDSPEGKEALAEARADFAAGRSRPLAEVVTELRATFAGPESSLSPPGDLRDDGIERLMAAARAILRSNDENTKKGISGG